MTTKRVVVVCGWLGAKARPVAKYAELYQQLGCDTVVLLSGGADLLQPVRFLHRNAVATLLTPLKQSPADTLELIPHMLSNGGCRSWYAVERSLRDADERYTVPAMVFDSAPSTNVRDAADYAWPATDELPTLRMRFLTRLMLIGMKWYPTLSRSDDAFEQHWQRYLVDQAHVPKLFLFSPHDSVVSPTNIRAAIARAKDAGSRVVVEEFALAKHVSLYTHAPERYASVVASFFKQVLA
ncbi:hypothetical protein SPRG_17720 [Saprolegnia parasitica CBS 223.65]|uniref:AB hydrolase-1 domain-containing protein n=1 Tax=Saprolegnia parasitica (strain CBS 223.65) TaxID=695850 RepID=A0A067BR55_SAPPC|nr:hypothetical protein SPRG_17720 [Saprolegnia parasitica CBS 223.65]KDO16791.1 hypothetical protein SPRG_17720 [Saprolegnia parasitica CBS 223.65]|eukprot:XP_012212501.1 hypothetical protein SPRG_17720 [Saprolegnia parasitica CBS 223.65]